MNEAVVFTRNTESGCKTVIGMMLSFICDRGRENTNNAINLLYHLIIWMNDYTTFSQYEMETIHYRSGVKCRLGVQCKLQINGKMGTADYRLFKYISCYFHCWVLTRNRLFRLIIVNVCTPARVNITPVSLNNPQVSLFTVSSQRW